jgi:hypothetical protein
LQRTRRHYTTIGGAHDNTVWRKIVCYDGFNNDLPGSYYYFYYYYDRRPYGLCKGICCIIIRTQAHRRQGNNCVAISKDEKKGLPDNAARHNITMIVGQNSNSRAAGRERVTVCRGVTSASIVIGSSHDHYYNNHYYRHNDDECLSQQPFTLLSPEEKTIADLYRKCMQRGLPETDIR